eukprot:CAMPEP_0205799356 /NCGR_PEP_ID=MMETSP0205-20121125/590_1 /ASSEMBLY_ACC=CAM_ASM_000278 /TAXON_ID=36767 /ORGANISM="Euplotes focardii, Strain TN1" /LENGTH=476 /DNA_ID=CAMNT_0053060513 /DNA_START=103 /DNA_END=1533 /DNA_ORIENTATION=+
MNIRFFDLDILLRRRTEIERFMEVLNFFKGVKIEESKLNDQSRITTKNYLNISKYSEFTKLLKNLSPTVFEEAEIRISLLPTPVILNSLSTEDDAATVKEQFEEELKSQTKFNPEFNILHVSTTQDPENINLELLPNCISPKIEYLHIMIPQNSGNLIEAFTQEGAEERSLKVLALQYNFSNISLMMNQLRNISEEAKSSLPNFQRVLALNQEKRFITSSNLDNEIYGISGKESGILENEEFDSLEITVQGGYTLHTQNGIFGVESLDLVKIGGTMTMVVQEDKVYLKADALIEVSRNTCVIEKKMTSPILEEFKGGDFFEISIQSMIRTVFKNVQSSESNFLKYIQLLETLEKCNPSCYNSLCLKDIVPESITTKLTNLHCICGDKGSPFLCNNISEDSANKLSKITCQLENIKIEDLENLFQKAQNLKILSSFLNFKYDPSIRETISCEEGDLRILRIFDDSFKRISYVGLDII